MTNATVCGYSPNNLVQCDVMAYNDAGGSDIGKTAVVRTYCAGKLSSFLKTDIGILKARNLPSYWLI